MLAMLAAGVWGGGSEGFSGSLSQCNCLSGWSS